VLESSRISLKVGGSFIDIHPWRGYRRCEDKPEWRWESGDVIKPLPVTELGEYKLQFHFTDDDDVPYANTKYIAYFADSSQINGVTDAEGFTTTFTTDKEEEIKFG
jgi:type VI secretion system secreted protein VgrG